MPNDAPDPRTATGPAQFIERLRELRLWAGQPSLRQLRELGGTTQAPGGARIDALPVSTVSHVLRGDRLPRMEFVRSFVAACLRARNRDEPDIMAYTDRWHEAWLRLQGDGTPGGTGHDPAPPTVPRQLPTDISSFTGRTDELAHLHKTAASAREPGPLVISAIEGVGGVGKSALTIHAAHQLADRFPDGQLYVDLRGATVDLAPLRPLEVLGRFLRGLGVAGSAIPPQLDEAAARFRTETAGKRLLILLDNARNEAQVRPLLPGSGGCQAIVTSRRRLAGLDAAIHLTLGTLPEPAAMALLGRIAGTERVAAEPAAATAVARLCGNLPLALRIAAARLAARPEWTVATLADRLTRDYGLAEFRAGDLAVRACLEVSHQLLRDSEQPERRAAAEVFDWLGVWCGPDFSVAAASRLTGLPDSSTEEALEQLVDARLVESHAPGRYQLHDLLRRYAREHAAERLTEPERSAARNRMVRYYAASASHAHQLLRPGDDHLARAYPQWTDGGDRFADTAEAMAWLDSERANLLAAVAQAGDGPDEVASAAIQLAQVLAGFFLLRSYWQDWEQVTRTALMVARRIGDQVAEAQAHSNLGGVYELRGDYPAAASHVERSLALRRSAGDRQGEGRSLTNLTGVYVRMRRYADAVRCGEQALAILGQLGARAIEAIALLNLGLASVGLGRYKEARGYGERSLARYRELGDDNGAANALGNLATVHRHLGRYDEAVDSVTQSLALRRRLGNPRGEADCLAALGAIQLAQQRYEEALGHFRQSAESFHVLGHERDEAEALRLAGSALRALGRHDEARVAMSGALSIYDRLGLPEADEVRTALGDL